MAICLNGGLFITKAVHGPSEHPPPEIAPLTSTITVLDGPKSIFRVKVRWGVTMRGPTIEFDTSKDAYGWYLPYHRRRSATDSPRRRYSDDSPQY